MKILSPFGPKLGKIKIPSKIISLLNSEVERIIQSKKKLKKNDYSKKVVGQVYQEIKISKKFIDKNLKRFIYKIISKYIKETINIRPKKFIIKNLWVVRQFKNEYNPVHFHDGYISGVGYLKVPKNLTRSKKKLNTNGTIDFINGTKTSLSNSIHNHIPKTGDMIIFPNNLMHTAYPFKVDGERRSFSFNLDLDYKTKKLLNV
ncbi:2OG-Fe(II) oxygenase family protein [Candidatus Pelagibacter sp.]|nr:2OG-Fe(II) oxygenase family protein [Candidatus Pelagibacter sp.]|tara:strand:- start:4509 stop:5117 length:609 start_codon:yes stop_codon:yes gene_type:complete